MDFTTACAFEMPLGKYKGKTLARVGSNNEGLRYLDWLVGQGWVNGRLREALDIYLKHPAVALSLQAAIGDDD